jgi:uncharacterized protein (DUF488 family)
VKVNLFTIGFAQRSACEFFKKLKEAGVKKVIDIRLNNTSQLAGFTKKQDLEYFLKQIGGVDYIHMLELAPNKDILTLYKKKEISWSEYERQFRELLTKRHIEIVVTPEEIDRACLLCSEAKPDKCHRRLVAEYLSEHWGNVIIQHL